MSYVKISSADNDIHDENSNIVAIKTWTKGGISASVNIIYLGTIDPYINLNKSQFEYEYNNIEFLFYRKRRIKDQRAAG